jgi:hypothetical protein
MNAIKTGSSFEGETEYDSYVFERGGRWYCVKSSTSSIKDGRYADTDNWERWDTIGYHSHFKIEEIKNPFAPLPTTHSEMVEKFFEGGPDEVTSRIPVEGFSPEKYPGRDDWGHKRETSNGHWFTSFEDDQE